MGMEKQALVWRFLMNFKLDFLFSKKSLRQFSTYALIGLLTNALGYSIYLVLTYLGGGPKLTMTSLYIVGTLVGFMANQRITFQQNFGNGVKWIRYIQAQVAGYLLNLTILILFVDWLNFSHQLIQAIAIIIVAIFLFIMLRVYVFAPNLAINGVAPE